MIVRALIRAERAGAKTPTVQELADLTGLGLATIHKHIAQMRNEGIIEQADGKYRAMRLADHE